MISPAQRMQLLTTTFFAALGPKIEAMQAAGKDVIRLDEGSPDLPPAPPIIQALARSTPAGRPGTGEEIAAAVVYFLTASNFVTGQVLQVDGGLTLG